MPINPEETDGAPELRLWLVLMKAYRALEREALGSISKTGMCFSDFQILELLLHKGPLAVNTIGAKIGLTSGSMTTAIDRLASRSLVERVGDPEDRRTRTVHLTDEGRKLIRAAFGRHRADMGRILSVLTEAEKDTAIGILKKLGKAAV
jgi:MarR family 2-MHQ and catechol resistance regulon transcriptional repressor